MNWSKIAETGLSGALTGGIGTLAGIGFGLLGNGIRSLFGQSDSQKAEKLANKQAAMNYEYTSRLMQQHHDYNVEDFEMMNEYNSPSNQRSRLEAAGINPAILGGVNSTTLGISPTSASGFSPVDYSGVVHASQQERLIDAQIASMNSQANLTNQQAKNIDIKNDYEALIGSRQVSLLDTQIKLNDKLTESEAQKIAESIARVDTTTKEAEARVENLRKQNSKIDFEQNIASAYLELETIFKTAEIDIKAQELALRRIQTMTGVSVAQAEIALKRANARESNARAAYQENVNDVQFNEDDSFAFGSLYRTRQVSELNSVDLRNNYQGAYNAAYLPTLRKRASSELTEIELKNAETVANIATQASEAIRKWIPFIGSN